jgi:large subunit ribosomal protein L18
MKRTKLKTARRVRRKRSLRHRILGTPSRPRLTVFRSNKQIYAQVIDDLAGRTLASASSKEKGAGGGGGNCTVAATVGKALGERAVKVGISAVVFDRNGYNYHGRIKALADAARESGLKF